MYVDHVTSQGSAAGCSGSSAAGIRGAVRPPVAGRVRRYPSDMRDAEWALIAPLLPVPACRTVRGGRPEVHDRRAIVDAIRYLVDNGCKWRALPADFPPWRTVYGFLTRWARAGVLARIRDVLRSMIRLRAGYNPQPTAAIIDSQSVRAAETVARTARGYDAGKKINGRKRTVVVDLGGWPLLVMVTSAGLQDRDIARELLLRLHLCHPQLPTVWADGAYRGALLGWAARRLDLHLQIVTRKPGERGFVVLPRRWVVERTLSWLSRARRTVRDYEGLAENSEAVLTWAAVTLMTRRLTQTRAAHSARGTLGRDRSTSAPRHP